MIILNLELVKNYPQTKITTQQPLVLPPLIAMEPPTTVYTPPMDPMTMVVVSPSNKKVDHVVETRTRIIKNNVILHANVDILTMIILNQELVKSYPQAKINNPSLVLLRLIAMELQTIVYSPLMDPMTMVAVSPSNKKVDLVVETRTPNIKNNVILHVKVDIPTMIIPNLEPVKNYPQTKITTQ